MLSIIKRNSWVLVILIIISCSKNKSENSIAIEEEKPQIVDISKFLEYNQNIDTLKLNVDITNKVFGNTYKSYNRYNTLSIDNNKGCIWYNDYLVTGIDEKGKESVLSFYTQNPNKGTEIFGDILVGKSKEDILRFMKSTVNENSHKELYSMHKDGYSIVICADEKGLIKSVSVLKSNDIKTIDNHLNRSNLFNHYDKN